jgi:hypothetical protein
MRTIKARKPKITTAAYRIAQLATTNNPVSILHLSKVAEFAQAQVDGGTPEPDAIAATAKFILKL